jgi:NAD(P)-dependent dehydrogenase (short-subunit alcohol dehydrogenase family)
MMVRLKGKVAVITGGASGIGQALAERFALEGADIAVVDSKSADATGKLVSTHGRKFISVTCDVSNPKEVEAGARQIREALSGADILVNNAAIFGKSSFEELSFEQWRSLLAVNLDGAFLMTKTFLPDLKKSGGGRIINMTSTTVWSNVPEMVHYITSKASLIGFTTSLATEVGKYGITVNAIAPSLVRTPSSMTLNSEEVFTTLANMQVINRTQLPTDITGAAVFLASEDAAFITAQVIAVDGGLTRR